MTFNVLAVFLAVGLMSPILHSNSQTGTAAAFLNAPLSTPSLFYSPLPTPSPSSPSTPSVEAQKALAYLTQRRGIPVQPLVIVTEHLTTFPILERKFRAVTILDTRPGGQFYKLLVDTNDGRVEEDLAALRDAEEKAYLQRYGRLQIALHKRLQEIDDDAMLPVAVWVVSNAPPQRCRNPKVNHGSIP